MTRKPLLTARGLHHAYGPTIVLDHVDLDIHAGTSTALMGPSGSGKTTLLHALAGILAPTRGTVTYHGEGLDRQISSLGEEECTRLRRTDFGLVFQSGQLLDELTVLENVALPLWVEGARPREARGAAEQAIIRLGLDGMGSRHPGQLSGGQRQRVAIARALITSPRIYFADEPTGALDTATANEVMTILQNLQRETGAALVLVTHDPAMAERCERVIHVRDGALTSTHGQVCPV
ncbi:ABC transporter ATP-binding protein [Austwickia chelonae]|uniref:Putative ABC transporter ATP-binding protein n=1 Tax=Austwickia chelonae NBRC 105200 TaxID=1184607 RepID=K6V686_9MICO|nr:ABC transporter ATP-binding protein [Austwickia chelonae]GAB77743.1 putative ABC transporter ATP-binding protein [Austwickia chelonae NBRC 105200]